VIASNLPPCYFDASWLEGAMDLALEEAQKAGAKAEVPVGAVLFWEGEVLARAHNVRETTNDPFGHAECLAIAEGAKKLGDWRLERAALVVTLEPCLMCMGTLLQTRVPLLVYGADDKRAGAAGSLYDLSGDPRLNHSIKVVRGVRREESAKLLTDFFEQRRG
jgi:tRNA(adenine34) deaminase